MLTNTIPRASVASRATATGPSPFSCSRSDAVNHVQVAVTGELDLATAPQVDQVLRHAQAEASVVVLDLRGLSFTDSSGAHLMLAADRRARESGGRLIVQRETTQLDRILELTGHDRRVELVDRVPPLHPPRCWKGAAD